MRYQFKPFMGQVVYMNTERIERNDAKIFKKGILALMPFSLGLMLMACSTGLTPEIMSSEPVTDNLVSAQNVAQSAAWSSNVNIAISGNQMTISSNGIPSHERSDFYLFGGRAQADPTQAQNISFTMPLDPEFVGNSTPTGAGPIGIAVSGAVFFNPYEGDQSTYALESNSSLGGASFIDPCNGHPIPNSGFYHYHGVPYCITDNLDSPGEHSVLIGYLRDGFAIYGPQDVGGSSPSSLDQCNGHFGETPEFPNGTYHYHTTEDRSYVPECYMGEAPTNNGQRGGPPAGPPRGGPPPGPPRPPAN
jgi:hypothetical protein